ncbi:MAG TPA: DUF4058 family protein [Pirellulales bacterium]|nr:DUF4058 family protein [Pirellulales bacterium]
MPVHDWTRASAGAFHDFHCTWIPLIKIRLNDGLLPSGYYAQVEQAVGDLKADILTLQTDAGPAPEHEEPGGIAVSVAPPEVEITASLEAAHYASHRRRLTVRHSSDDRVVAMIEVVSPGNKAGRRPWRKFVEKTAGLILEATHLLIVDLFPPGPRDPQGVHGAVWAELGDDSYTVPTGKPLTLAAYAADDIPRAYVQPLAVGDVLPPMPLFLTPETYIPVPLEQTYQAAYHSVPQRWRTVLEAT